MKQVLKYWGLITALLVILANTFYHSRWDNSRTEAPISWDVSGYYAYLPAIFIHKDIKKLEYLPGIIDKYKPSPSMDQAFMHESGNYIFKYSLGQSLTYLPGFLIGHAWASLSNTYPADGYSYPYQFSVYWFALSLGLLGLLVLFKIIYSLFDPTTANWTIILIAAGTNLLEYASYTPMMTHISLFTLYTLLIRQCISFWNTEKNQFQAMTIGLIIGLMALIRPTELIAILIPLLWGIEINKAGIIQRIQELKIQLPKLAIASVCGAIILFLQPLYWKIAGGEFIIYSYQDQGFSWFKPHIKNVLISYRKGWLVYTPMMIFGLIGFVQLYKKHIALFWACLIFFTVNFYVVSSWDIWWYGGSFGQRALVQSYAIMAFPLAAFIQNIKTRKIQAVLIAPLMLFFIVLNNFQIWQSHTTGLFDAEYTNRAYYWRMFFKTEFEPTDKLLIDSKEACFGTRIESEELVYEDFESDSSIINTSIVGVDNSKAQRIDNKNPYSKTFSIKELPMHKKWLSISADFFVDQKEYDIWSMAALVVEFKKDDKNVKYRHIKFPRLLNSQEWKNIELSCKFPKKEIDEVRFYVFLPKETSKTYRWDNISMQVFNEE
jgi:hypothetical protein